MKAVVGVAVVLGLAGTVLGIIALMDGGGVEYGEEQTLVLTAEGEERIDFEVEDRSHREHPLEGWATARDVTGDATGQYVSTCLPLVREHIECNGAFQLDGGDIEAEGTGDAVDRGSATHTIVGGNGEYEGATGEFDIDWETDTFTLRFHVLEE